MVYEVNYSYFVLYEIDNGDTRCIPRLVTSASSRGSPSSQRLLDWTSRAARCVDANSTPSLSRATTLTEERSGPLTTATDDAPHLETVPTLTNHAGTASLSRAARAPDITGLRHRSSHRQKNGDLRYALYLGTRAGRFLPLHSTLQVCKPPAGGG